MPADVAPQRVYFQPPASVRMAYPCIVYERSGIDTKYADGIPYRHLNRYSVTVIDANPDSGIPDRLARLPSCAFDRHYTADNLYHDTFTVYY